jgi:hypothetical protein
MKEKLLRNLTKSQVPMNPDIGSIKQFSVCLPTRF